MQRQFALESLEKHLCSVPETEHLIGEEKQGKKITQKNKEGRKKAKQKDSIAFHGPMLQTDGGSLLLG